MDVVSCQVSSIPVATWKKFRKICIEEGVSINQKMKMLIEAEVARQASEE
jgi:hypothetical protein